jgi:hypothetical protein
MGLIRKALVVGGIIFAMPSPPATVQTGQVAQSMPDSTSWNYISAAADTVADMKSFCERKPQVCITAQYLAVSMEGKARYSAKLIYEWANESAKGQTAALPNKIMASDPINTGTLKTKLRGTIAENSTLKMEDLIPEWHGTLDPDQG